ncbi:hypothetical protein TNCV_1870321 [Trichonephila clavipes]|nr:hypothetical protein TNCV_1870321 [Trichonephila clavipes]
MTAAGGSHLSIPTDWMDGIYTLRNFNITTAKSTGVISGGHVNLQRLLMILRLGRPDLTRSSSDPVFSIAEQDFRGVPLSKAFFQSSHFSEVGIYATQQLLIP